MQAAFDNQQKQIADMERFVERFKAKASKAKQAQSRVKALEKIDRIEMEDEDSSAMRFYFPEPPRSGKVVLEAHHVTKRYDAKLVLDDVSIELVRGEHVAFVGKNGEGKSTLSKILVGKEPYEGELKLGHNTMIGYYGQNQSESLDPDKTVLQTIDDAATGDMRLKVRALLGAFLFSGEAVEKKVRVLSGGEKARLSLAKLLLQPMNLLVMDEPTNHLDMRSKDILKEALMKYTGALVVVSHDRDFLQGLTKKVFEFKNKKIKEHLGDVYSYLESRKLETLDALNLKQEAPKEVKPIPEPVAALNREERKTLENKKKKLERSVADAEANISRLEGEVSDAEKALNDPANSARQLELLAAYEKLQQKLTEEMQVWEDSQAELEEVAKKLG
jgi:ATP-binding cassette subfamily F protein 3